MHRQNGIGPDESTGGTRTENAPPDGHVQHAHTKSRTPRRLSVERALVSVDYDAALTEFSHANTSIADGYLDVTESVVRRLRSADKPVSVAHLSLGPEDVFRRVIVRAAVRAFGVTGATTFFAECIADLTRRTP